MVQLQKWKAVAKPLQMILCSQKGTAFISALNC